jgi:hypothetical protein
MLPISKFTGAPYEKLMSRRFGREGCDQSITAADAASAVSSPARFPQPLVGADAVAAATEWDEFRKGNLAHLRDLMRQPIVFDGGNIYDPEMMEQLGFTYFSVGRPVRTRRWRNAASSKKSPAAG